MRQNTFGGEHLLDDTEVGVGSQTLQKFLSSSGDILLEQMWTGQETEIALARRNLERWGVLESYFSGQERAHELDVSFFIAHLAHVPPSPNLSLYWMSVFFAGNFISLFFFL